MHQTSAGNVGTNPWRLIFFRWGEGNLGRTWLYRPFPFPPSFPLSFYTWCVSGHLIVFSSYFSRLWILRNAEDWFYSVLLAREKQAPVVTSPALDVYGREGSLNQHSLHRCLFSVWVAEILRRIVVVVEGWIPASRFLFVLIFCRDYGDIFFLYSMCPKLSFFSSTTPQSRIRTWAPWQRASRCAPSSPLLVAHPR